MNGVAVVILGTVCALSLVNALSIDSVFTNGLQDVVKGDEFVVTLKHLKPRRRHRIASETLFAVDFPNSDNKFAVLLDRTEKNVIIDTVEDGRRREQHFTVDTLESDTVIRSLILAFDQKQPGAKVSLYVDCVAYGMIATPKTMRDMYTKMESPSLQMMRDRKYHMEIDNDSLKKALLNSNCSIDVSNTHTKRNLDLLFHANPSLSNELADEPRSLHHIEPFIPSGRGDIPLPLLPEVDDCTVIIKAINQLTIAVNQLGAKIDRHTDIIANMDKYLKECNYCPSQLVATCKSSPLNCYHGVSCIDTFNGPKCGNCPPGYKGDGVNCEKIRILCTEKQCAPGVQCHETSDGAVCGSCPPGYTGNGEYCERVIITCAEKQCAPGVQCRETPDGARCGSCPPGYSGNGEYCEKVRITCSEKQCAPGVQCHETSDGARCGSCPPGYSGDGEYCERVRITCSEKQCAPGVQCHESSDGARCGPCPPGYSGDGEYCERVRITCSEKQCAPGVQCHETPHGARCGSCPPGYTGNGEYCERIRITCAEKHCAAGVQCYESADGARCGNCPAGYTGDGERCEPDRTCRTYPCFHGVVCRDTAGGPECGDCPHGYHGDGRDCRPGHKCKDKPCFQDVPCYDTERGAECGNCPSGYEGDGIDCRPTQERCHTHNPCYHGVQCYDTANGPTCGSCPNGMTGDGYRCRYRSCSDRPCFRGVSCEDTPSGPKCGPCPAGFTGDGIQCRRICDYRPCGNDVDCYETSSPPYYSCSCPPGSEFNVSTCVDIDECVRFKPCDPLSHCYNKQPGYECGPCPPGYTGNSGGYFRQFAPQRSHHYRCVDIDECAEGLVHCPPGKNAGMLRVPISVNPLPAANVLSNVIPTPNATDYHTTFTNVSVT